MNDKQVHSTDPFNNEMSELIEELSRINDLLKNSKTSLKKDYYKKKLDKIKQKTYKILLSKAMADPSILKRDINDE